MAITIIINNNAFAARCLVLPNTYRTTSASLFDNAAEFFRGCIPKCLVWWG